MKILHTADWHLGAYVGPQCDDPMEKMENTLRCLDVLVETAEKEQPDIILIAGDIFHTAKVWSDRANVELRVAAEYIDKLYKIAPTVVLYGTPNHDNMEQFCTLKKLTSAIFISEPEVMTIATMHAGVIQVAGLPGFDKGMFRSQYPGLSAEEENRIFTEQLDSIVQGLSAQLNPTIPSVLMAHHTVVGCSLDNGQHVFQQNDVVLSSETLDNSTFDMVCLGHIHVAQKLTSCSKPVYYSGSIDAVTFNDEGNEKGFWIHDTNYLFMPEIITTPARKFITCNWNQELVEMYISKEWEGDLERMFSCDSITGKVVRVLYSCDKATEKALDKKKLERDLYAAGAYYVSEIRPEKVTTEVNKEKLHEKLTVWECLRNYLKEKFKDKDLEAILTEAEPIVSEIEASAPAGAQTGMFLPLEIEVRNYRSYAEEKLGFEDLFFCMVNGKNGTGKSSLVMDALIDCIYEQPREGELTGWIKSSEKSGSIIFTFLLGSDSYRVTRTRQRSGKATLALAKLEGLGQGISYNKDFPLNWIDISCQRLVDTQEKIVQLLGMDADTFRSCVLIMQDQYGRFMEAKSEDRMSVLANLLGLGVYEQLEDKTKKLLQDCNRQLKQSKDEISTLEMELSVLKVIQSQKVDNEKALSTEQAALTVLRKDQDDTSQKVALYNSNKLKLVETISEISKKDTALTEDSTKFDNLTKDILQTKEFLKLGPIYTTKHDELIKIKNQLTAMEGTIILLDDKRKSLNRIVSDVNNTNISKERYQRELKEINDKLQEYDTLAADLEKLKGVEDELNFQDEKKSKHDDMTRKIIESTGALSKCDSNIRIYEQQTAILKNSNCIDIDQAQCGFLMSAKESEIKLQDLQKIKIIISSELCSLEDIKKNLTYDAAYHSLVRADFDKAQRTKTYIATLDSEKKSADMYEKQIVELETKDQALKVQKVDLEAEISNLEPQVSNVPQLVSKAKELQENEESFDGMAKAIAYLEAVEPQLFEIGKNISALTIEKAELDKKHSLLKFDIDNCQKYVDSLQVLATEIQKCEINISNYNRVLGSLDERIRVLADKGVELLGKQDGVKLLADKANRLQVLANAFSQDGIPHQIVRDIVPDLEESANEILSRMTGGRMSLEFRTEKTLKSNKDKEIPVLDVMITDIDNGELPYLSRSGGQKTRCSLSVIFALAILKASRMGLQLGMLFIDEPAGLDEEGIDGYCTALETIHTLYPDMRIVAISHDERMKVRFAQHLFVEVTENGSKVRKS
jgi:exonuclease SbcD